MFEVVLQERYQPTIFMFSETVVKKGLTQEEARREALMCNTNAFSNEYYFARKTLQS